MLINRLVEILREVGISPDRELGQNFLVNPSIAARIAAQVPREDSVLEIGPGLGSLTEKLVPLSGSLTMVEISSRMSRYLSGRFQQDNVHVVTGDFLSIQPSDLPGFPFRALAGNLPYCISSPIIFRLLEEGFSSMDRAVIMLQREVARRLSALDGGRDYGKLSLQVWPVFTVEHLLDADPEDFFPVPEVRSSVVVLNRRSAPLMQGDVFLRFRRLVKISFAMRRKTILNNLKACMDRESAAGLLEEAGIDPGLRAEQVPPEGFARLAEVFP
jgi:16S rRNA (adenine1518-N6/adenine1519-N6)-dimethyltransferase